MKCPMKVMKASVVNERLAALLDLKQGEACEVSEECGGELELLQTGQTYLGNVVGIDPNEHREVYRCRECGAVVERSFKWMLVKEGE